LKRAKNQKVPVFPMQKLRRKKVHLLSLRILAIGSTVFRGRGVAQMRGNQIRQHVVRSAMGYVRPQHPVWQAERIQIRQVAHGQTAKALKYVVKVKASLTPQKHNLGKKMVHVIQLNCAIRDWYVQMYTVQVHFYLAPV
jgi:hypothetical protein